MSTKVEKFHPVSISNASVQFKEGATHKPGQSFGCIGSIEGETEITLKQLKCGAKILKEKSAATKQTLTVVLADVPVQVARDVFGMSNEGLKEGVYSYGTNSKGKSFIFTADVLDDFEDVTKMMAWPNCSTATGFKISVDNAADEVANIEFELTALPDGNSELVYEAIVNELTDTTVSEQWHTAFTRDLVAKETV